MNLDLAMRSGVAFACALALSACATTVAPDGSSSAKASASEMAVLERVLSGRSAVEGDALAAKVKEASEHPLGSTKNPVRAEMPRGQRAYLNRLRCSDLTRPNYVRLGSAGMSPYGNIVDIYEVTCKGAEPAKAEVYMDMYHRGHIEDEAVPGFGIVGGRAV